MTLPLLVPFATSTGRWSEQYWLGISTSTGQRVEQYCSPLGPVLVTFLTS